MSEVEKLYELAGVEYYDRYFSCIKDKDLDCQDNCEICDDSIEVKCYPPFTAEKQLELIKWLATTRFGLIISGNSNFKNWRFGNSQYSSNSNDVFKNALALRIIDLWQDLTEEERETIRGILRT